MHEPTLSADTPRVYNPEDLQAYLEHHNIDACIVHCDSPTPTVAAAAAALGVASTRIIKSLLFIADDVPQLVVAAGEARISQKRLRDVLGVSRRKLRMATPEEACRISGFAVGAMPPFGHRQALATLIDSLSIDCEAKAAILYGGGGGQAAMLELRTDTLLQVSQGAAVAISTILEDV